MQEVTVKIPKSQSNRIKVDRFLPDSYYKDAENRRRSAKRKAPVTVYTHRFTIGNTEDPIQIDLSNLPQDIIPIDVAREEMQKSYDKGYDDGQESEMAAAQAEIKKFVGRMRKIEELALDFEKQYQSTIEKLENSIVKLSMIAAGHILRSEIREDPNKLVHRIKEILNEVRSGKDIQLRMSPESIKILKEVESNLLSSEGEYSKIEIIEDDSLEYGDCIIETQADRLDAKLKSELDKLFYDIDRKFKSERLKQEIGKFEEAKDKIKDKGDNDRS